MCEIGSPGATIRSNSGRNVARRASAATKAARPGLLRARLNISSETSIPTAGATRESAAVIRPRPAPISRTRRGLDSRAIVLQKSRCARERDSFS